jgi:hypothetical protein
VQCWWDSRDKQGDHNKSEAAPKGGPTLPQLRPLYHKGVHSPKGPQQRWEVLVWILRDEGFWTKLRGMAAGG